MTNAPDVPRPAEFARRALASLAASEGRRRRRRRNTQPDRIGLDIKRDLLERTISVDPNAEAYEAWLLEQVLGASASGPVRAVCVEIRDEYRLAGVDRHFADWLERGAPSDDAEPPAQ